jgi:hypothetical protein
MAKDDLKALEAKLAKLQAENEKLKAKNVITLKVSTKGAVSLYGLGRWPITLYAGQWERVLEFVGAEEDNKIAAFIEDNRSKLSFKDDGDKE